MWFVWLVFGVWFVGLPAVKAVILKPHWSKLVFDVWFVWFLLYKSCDILSPQELHPLLGFWLNGSAGYVFLLFLVVGSCREARRGRVVHAGPCV